MYVCFIPVKVTIKAQETKTTKALRILFPGLDFVSSYEETRKRYEKNRQLYEEDFKKITAKIEVKIVQEIDRLKEEMRKVEKKAFDENNNLSTLPKDPMEMETYNTIKKNLSLLYQARKLF